MPRAEHSDGVGVRKRGIFTVDGASVVFSFHKSVTEGARDVLSTKIEENGGELSDEAEGADVLLYDPRTTNESLLRAAYAAHSNRKLQDLWLKPVSHIKQSIRRGYFELLPPRRQAMPGPGPGRSRVEFSQEDKENLARYLASRVPVPAEGGLQGKVIYKELVDLHKVDSKEYEWVKRHTIDSWREHYKKNQAYFHALIADHVNQYPIHDRHRYFRTRELNRGVKRSHSDDEEEDEEKISRQRRKRLAREEERRQRSIARRQEDEENSEEDDAFSRTHPQNATPGPSGTDRRSFEEGMTTLVEKDHVIKSQTPPGSPVQMHFSPEPQRQHSAPRLPAIETIDIESETEIPPRPKFKSAKFKPAITRAKSLVVQIPVQVHKEETTSPTLGPKAKENRRAKTSEPIVVDLEKTKTPTPGDKEDPIVVESEILPKPAPRPKANERRRAKTPVVEPKKTKSPTPGEEVAVDLPEPEEQPKPEPTVNVPPKPTPKPKASGRRRAKTPVVEPQKARTPTPGDQAAAESEPEEQPKPEPNVKGKARSTRTPARKTPTPDIAPPAPYRNTRSRSRSVEPVELPPTRRRRVNKKPDLQVVEEQADEEMSEAPIESLAQPEPKKRRGNKKQVPEAVEEHEDGEGDETVVQPRVKEQSVDQVLEGPEDEWDEEEKIEDLLRSEDPNNIIPNTARPRRPQPSFTDFEPDDVGPQMYDTMDEDDRQTRSALFSGDEDDEDEEDEEGQVPLFTQADDAQIEVVESQEKPLSTQHLSHSLTKFNSRRTRQVAAPVTPARQVRLRRDSTESSEHFPLEDTGAGKKLKEMHNIGKVTPYIPPSGSRAARHLLERST